MNLEPYCQFAVELAEKSGDFIRPMFGCHDVEVELKADESPVTAADRGAEELMREMIGKKFPDHGVIGEEYGVTNPGAEFVWVLDPIDGTKSFATAVPLFGTLIGLQYQGKAVAGVIHQPILRQLCLGTDECTTLNGEKVVMRTPKSIATSTLLTTDTLRADRMHGEKWSNLALKANLVRTWGDCYGYILLATGWADIMVDPKMEIWDLLALIPVIRGAGGKITSFDGGEPTNAAVAAHPAIHDEVLRLLNMQST